MGQYFGLSPVIKRGPTTVPCPSIPFPFFNNTPILEPFEFTKEAMDFPVQHKKLSLDIKGNKTDIVICAYDDHFLVIATQIGSMGTILHARKEEGVAIHPTFSVSVLLGKRDEPMLIACARQIIEHISNAGSSRSLVLSLGLRDHSLPTLKGIVSAVTENCLW